MQSKPEAAREKIVDGMLAKRFFAASPGGVLVDQAWIHDSAKTVGAGARRRRRDREGVRTGLGRRLVTVRPDESAATATVAPAAAFRRVLLKLSGETLMGDREYGVDPGTVVVDRARGGRRCATRGTEVAVVVGGGNFYRGMKAAAEGMDRATADYAGMLATLLNALALQDALERLGADTRVQSAIAVSEVAEPYIRRRAMRHLEKGRVVLFAAGTGNPFFTTDTAGALRALEIGAEAILMAKNGVRGVYDGDPKTDPDARFLPELTHLEAIERGLQNHGHDRALALHGQQPRHPRLRAGGGEHPARRGGRAGRHGDLEPEGAIVAAIEEFLADATRRMDTAIEHTRQEFNSIRTGRASAALLDRITVDYYGTPTQLKNMATITAPEPRLLAIQPFDPTQVRAIEKAIMESDLGLTPSNDGKLIRLPIPQLTEERRKDLVKLVRRYAEEGKVSDPQRPPGRDAPPGRARQERRGRRRRRAARRSAGAEAHRRAHRPHRRGAQAQRSGDHGGLIAPRSNL